MTRLDDIEARLDLPHFPTLHRERAEARADLRYLLKVARAAETVDAAPAGPELVRALRDLHAALEAKP